MWDILGQKPYPVPPDRLLAMAGRECLAMDHPVCLHGCVLPCWVERGISPSPCPGPESTGDAAVCSHQGMVQPTPAAAASIKTPSPRAGDVARWLDEGGRLRLRVAAIQRYSTTFWHVQVLGFFMCGVWVFFFFRPPQSGNADVKLIFN